MTVDASDESLRPSWSAATMFMPLGICYILEGIIVKLSYLIIDVLQEKALRNFEKYRPFFSCDKPCKLITTISSEDNYNQHNTTKKINYVYFNRGTLEPAFLVARFVIEVI